MSFFIAGLISIQKCKFLAHFYFFSKGFSLMDQNASDEPQNAEQTMD